MDKNMEKELILMVGPIGAGKTTFSNSLIDDCTVRISQDEMGRGGHRTKFTEALHDGIPRIIVDRMNFNRQQRNWYIKLAREEGYVVTIFDFDWDYDVCMERVVAREGHPTVRSGDKALAAQILNFFRGAYEKPEPQEYDNYNKVELDV